MERITHSVQQGSDEWLKLRKDYYPASLAAAAMGISKFVSRGDLVKHMATGTEQEHSDYTKDVIFKAGHKAEESARLIIESRICEDLFPVVMTQGKFLASVDGITLEKDMIFEHKMYNVSLHERVANKELPDQYMPQVQQCLMVTGADKCMFVVSDGTGRNMASMIIRPDSEYQALIKAAWLQVQKEVDAYVPDVEVQVVEGVCNEFPIAVHAVVTGSVTSSNVKEMEAQAKEYFANFNRTLDTDQDFANAESHIKFCKKVETAMKAAEAGVLNQSIDINELLNSLRNINSLASKDRLFFEKEVKRRKEAIKAELIADAVSDLHKHIASLDEQIAPLTLSRSHDFNGVIKGLKTTKSVKNSLNSHLAELIIGSNKEAEKLRVNMDWFKNFTTLFKADVFRDISEIAHYEHEAFKALCESRKSDYDAQMKEEIERKEVELQKAVDSVDKEPVVKENLITESANAATPDRADPNDRAITELYGRMMRHVNPSMSTPAAVSKIAELIVKGVIDVNS